MRSILICLMFVTTAQADPPKWEPLDSCVGVQARGGYAGGTAVPGAPKGLTFIVTAKHVTDQKGDDVYWENILYPYTIVVTDPTNDLAVIVVNAELPTVPVATTLTTNQPISIRGFGWSFFQPRTGKLLNTSGSSATLKVKTGDSGCGYITNTGELAGVHSGGAQAEGIMNTRAAPASAVSSLIEKAKKTKYDLPPKPNGPAPTPATRYVPKLEVPKIAQQAVPPVQLPAVAGKVLIAYPPPGYPLPDADGLVYNADGQVIMSYTPDVAGVVTNEQITGPDGKVVSVVRWPGKAAGWVVIDGRLIKK